MSKQPSDKQSELNRQGRNSNEIYKVHRCIRKEGQKSRKCRWWQRWGKSRKIKTHNRESKTRPISVCECL